MDFGVTLSKKNILNQQNCVTSKHIKTDSFYQDISNDVEENFSRCDVRMMYDYDVERCLPISKNKKSCQHDGRRIRLVHNEGICWSMIKNVLLQTNITMKKKKSRLQKKCVIKHKIKFDDNKNSLKTGKNVHEIQVLEKNSEFDKKIKNSFLKENKIPRKSEQRFKKDSHNSSTIKVNKKALSIKLSPCNE